MPDVSDPSGAALAAKFFQLCQEERELAAELRALEAELARRKRARAAKPASSTQRNDHGGSGPEPPTPRTCR